MTGSRDFNPEWIWGDVAETAVFAQGYGSGLTVIFRFGRAQSRPPSTLANRVCASFHALDDTDPFASPDAMRQAIWAAVGVAWPRCLEHPLIGRLDAVVDIDAQDGNVTWSVDADPLFQRHVRLLAEEQSPGTAHSVVDFASLTRFEQLGGRGCATRVRLQDDFFVFKGIDFRTFLTHSDDGDDDRSVRHIIRGWRNSDDVLRRIPPHPNIMPAPTLFAAIRYPDAGATPVVCGCLQPLYSGGDVAARIEESNKQNKRLPLGLKAHWCADMAAAVHHVHRVAKTYHMDIKPGNFIADTHDNLVLGDWEQNDAPPTILAPEADGTWDVCQEPHGTASRPHLAYTKYTGPPRRNDADQDALDVYTWHVWNVFPIWNIEHPLALELAEVFSLGRAMWMLLRQPDMDFNHVEHPSQLVTDWDGSDDIPDAWKHMVDSCLSQDPNQRPDVSEVHRFWAAAWEHRRGRD